MKEILSKIDHGELFKAADLFAIPHFKTVYDLYREYQAAGNYPYISAVADYIEKKLVLDLDETEKKNLESFVFYAARQTEEDHKTEYVKIMLSAGWLVLTTDLVKQAYDQRRKIKLAYETCSILGVVGNTEKIFRPFVTLDDEAYLMKPKAKKRGYPVTGFQNAFCKIV